jgi:DNA end-binding protein Ku
MTAYTLRDKSELRDHKKYFRDVKDTEIGEDELNLAESLIKKRTSKFNPGKFVDGCEIALQELVDAKVDHLLIPGRRHLCGTLARSSIL